MEISDLKSILGEIIHDTLYINSKLNKEQKENVLRIKEFLAKSNNVLDDIRTLVSLRNNENYFAYDDYITDFILDSNVDVKLEVLNNQNKYTDLIDDEDSFIDIWNSLKITEKVTYLEEKRKFTDIDIALINNDVSDNGSFKDNILLNEILNNEDIRKKINPFSIILSYSYNLLSTINLNDYDMCNILTKSSYTKLLLKKCKTFDDFKELYDDNKKIFNLISTNSLIFRNEDNEAIYKFILDNPNFIGKFNTKYLDLFNIVEISKLSKNKTLDSDAFSSIIQKLYRFNETEANNYFSEENLKKCSIHSITVYPFNNINKELQNTIFNDYSLFNRFLDTIMIEAINNTFEEDDVVNILRNDVFINDMSSYAIELLLNKLTFKSAFNMMQRKIIFEKINNLNVKVDKKDSLFFKGFLDSPILVYKSEHNMIYEMLNILNNEDVEYYITLPYIISNLSNYEITTLMNNKELDIDLIVNAEELRNKLNLNDIMIIIDKYIERKHDLSIFKNRRLSKELFNISDEQFDEINFDEVNYLFETVRTKSILSKQESEVDFLSYKSVLVSYLVLGLEETLELINNGDMDISLDEIKSWQRDIVNEKILMFKENNAAVFQNMHKKILNALHEYKDIDDINEFARNIKKNTYLDNIVYLMLENNFDSYNRIIEKLFSYVKYSKYNEFASKKEIYDYANNFTEVYLNNKAKEYNDEFEKVILKNFKVLESVIYSKRKEYGKEFLKKLKFKLFVRALNDPNKESYSVYFKDGYPIKDIKKKYLKLLANENVDFDSLLEHVLIPIINDRFDSENCLNKLGIHKPKDTDEYNKYLKDLKTITELNIQVEKLKDKYNTEQLLTLMNYICYKTNIDFKVDKKTMTKLNKMLESIDDLDGETYIDKSAIKFIYKDNLDVYNIEEIIEYNNYMDILENIIKKTNNYISRNMNSERILNNFSHDYFKAMNTESCVFPITSKYYEPKRRVFALCDLENIFNGYDLSNYKKIDGSLKEFLFDKKNLIMVADGYFNGVVDNLGLIISKWDRILEYLDKFSLDINELSLIGIESILTLINFEDNVLGKAINKEIIKDICEDGYYEVNDLNKRINIVIDLFKQCFKRIKSTIPYLSYNNDVYKVEVIDSYNQDILDALPYSLYKVGASGNDFLHYSIINKNGLQIGIYRDDKLVAKVLGIRNGNTIYLNALDGDSDENYNDLLRLFANELIKITKNDLEPIEFITIVNNENFNSINGLKLDTTICPYINNPINKMYYDYEEFSEYKNLLNPDDIYTNYQDNISTLLANNKVVDKNNFKYYDADDKYYRHRNDVIKLSNNIGEDYLKKIDTILYLCKEEDESININDIILSAMKTIYLGDDFVVFVTEKNNIFKYILPYDDRALREVDKVLENIERS